MRTTFNFEPDRFRELAKKFESPDHDLLLIARDTASNRSSLISCPVERTASGGVAVGDYRQAPRRPTFADRGVRKVMGIAREEPFTEAGGPVFATLPVKPEPGSTHLICYFVNSTRLGRRRWSFDDEPTQPPPSLVVAEDSGDLRLYESVGRLEGDRAGDCRKVLEAGFIVGTLPNRAVYGDGMGGTTAVVNLTPLEAAGAPLQPSPGLAIITPHDDANKRAKVFWFRNVEEGSAPISVAPGSEAYDVLTHLSALGPSKSYDNGAALALVRTDHGDDSPADAVVICSRNLQYKNEWTRADWAGPQKTLERIRKVTVRPSLVVATADGGLHKYLGGQACLPLGLNTDAWNQLRNGCVLGTIERRRVGGSEALVPLPGGERVPIVNLSSLDPDSPFLDGDAPHFNFPSPRGRLIPRFVTPPISRKAIPQPKARRLSRKP